MKSLKLWSIMMGLLIVLGTAITFTSCSNDDDEEGGGGGGGNIPSGLIGTWCGEQGRYYCTVTFYSNGTMETELTSNVSTSNFVGTYTVKGSTITAKGESVRVFFSDGEVEHNKNLTFTYTYSGSSLSGGIYETMKYEKL